MTASTAMTMKDRCEVISRHWETCHHRKVAPIDIFNYSPSGELYMVFEWYEDAKACPTCGEVPDAANGTASHR